MKIYALFIVVIVALAGCSTSYKGSIQGSSNPDGSKSGSYVASQTAANQSNVSTDK
jgi:outer membrane protein assembly factor BamE (lipoprotein component of BamABCDE complex)